MKAIDRRLRKLEVATGIVETEESRRDRALAEELRRRRDAWLTREGLPIPPEPEPEDFSGMTLAEILITGRRRALQRQQTGSE